VGEASRIAAESRRLRVGRISPEGTGESLWQSLAADPDGARRIFYPRASLAPEPREIAGVTIECPILYETAARAIDPAAIAGATIAALASPSAVGPALAAAPQIRCASLGPTTTAALRRRGVEPWVQAPAPSFGALARAVAAQLTASAGGPPATSGHSPAPRT
jgi:uroporphyrinogen-III synthase